MTWSIHHVSLLAHDLDAAAHFFGTLIGLGAVQAPDARTRFIGEAGRGLRLHRPGAALARSGAALLGPMGARYVALEVASLAAVVAKLDQAGLAYAPALPGEFSRRSIRWTRRSIFWCCYKRARLRHQRARPGIFITSIYKPKKCGKPWRFTLRSSASRKGAGARRRSVGISA